MFSDISSVTTPSSLFLFVPAKITYLSNNAPLTDMVVSALVLAKITYLSNDMIGIACVCFALVLAKITYLSNRRQVSNL